MLGTNGHEEGWRRVVTRLLDSTPPDSAEEGEREEEDDG